MLNIIQSQSKGQLISGIRKKQMLKPSIISSTFISWSAGMKNLLILLFLMTLMSGFSEVILLKSGEVLEGRLLEQKSDSIILETAEGEKKTIDPGSVARIYMTRESYEADKAASQKSEPEYQWVDEKKQNRKRIPLSEKSSELLRTQYHQLNKKSSGLMTGGGILLAIGIPSSITIFAVVMYNFTSVMSAVGNALGLSYFGLAFAALITVGISMSGMMLVFPAIALLIAGGALSSKSKKYKKELERRGESVYLEKPFAGWEISYSFKL
jgi:hypothetical protein